MLLNKNVNVEQKLRQVSQLKVEKWSSFVVLSSFFEDQAT